MPLLSIGGATIHFTEYGQGQPVVLVHGFPLDGRMWRHQAGLASVCRLITIDVRGFGGSSTPMPFSIETIADDIQALCADLKLGPIVLGGLSMGGYVALAYAKKYAASLRGLMLLDTRADGDAPPAKENRNKMIATVQQQGPAPVADAMVPRLIAESTAKGRPAVAQELRQMIMEQPAEAIGHALAALRDRPDQTAMLASIAAPTLVLGGEADVVTPPEVMKVFADNIPRARHIKIPDAGHMAPFEQPAAVNRVIEQFLASL